MLINLLNKPWNHPAGADLSCPLPPSAGTDLSCSPFGQWCSATNTMMNVPFQDRQEHLYGPSFIASYSSDFSLRNSLQTLKGNIYYRSPRREQLKRLLPTLAIILLLLLLSACSNTPTNQTNSSEPIVATSGATTTGTFHEYSLPQSNSDIMRPAIDHEGRIWFGEMGHNYLAVFDPHTQTFQQTMPPHGASGIMGIIVASDDTIWFAEQYANYIGHYNPTTQRYQIYNLPQLHVPDPNNKQNTLTLPSAPNDIAFDTRGNLWCTELNADSLAMLDPHTGHIKQYPLSAHATVQTLNPYGIAVDSQGMIWFTESSTNHLGKLDPQTGTIRTFNAPGTNTTLMEVASDSHGTIWATSFSTSQLFKFDPTTSDFTIYNASSTNSTTGGLYGLAITPTNDIWVTLTQNNAIAQLDPSTQRFIPYQIPTTNSLPFGITIGKNHTLWFTESHGNKIGMLQL